MSSLPAPPGVRRGCYQDRPAPRGHSAGAARGRRRQTSGVGHAARAVRLFRVRGPRPRTLSALRWPVGPANPHQKGRWNLVLLGPLQGWGLEKPRPAQHRLTNKRPHRESLYFRPASACTKALAGPQALVYPTPHLLLAARQSNYTTVVVLLFGLTGDCRCALSVLASTVRLG